MYDVHSDNPAFQELFRRTPYAMFVVDVASLRFLAVNPAATAQYGYTADEFLALTLMDIRSDAEQARLKSWLSKRPSAPVWASGRWRHLRKDGSELVADITAYSLSFDSREAKVILAIDVTRQVSEEERTRQYVEKLEAALSASIKALSSMVELRDPYTAGHQQRVSRLAIALAREMQLDENTQAGLGVMGLVHDIGKIGIPGEILSKPISLTVTEYELVKSHVQFGYEILAKLQFNWPVAECVLQHHERLAGSGYPYALKAGDIRFEARILAVADVMESVSAHRPYHPGYGDKKALDEVIMGSGVLYDADVVGAAVRLFRSGFAIH